MDLPWRHSFCRPSAPSWAEPSAVPSARRSAVRSAGSREPRSTSPLSEARRANPAGLRPRSARRAAHLGDETSRGGQHRDRALWIGRRQGLRRARGRDHHLHVFRQPCGWDLRGTHRPRAPRLGGRARDQPHGDRTAGASRHRGSGARSSDRREGRRRERAGLSRSRLRGVRRYGAGAVRQQGAAVLLRDRAHSRRAARDDPRRLPDPGRERVRLCHGAGDAGSGSARPGRRTATSCSAGPTSWPPSMRSRPCARASSASPSW